MADDYEVKHISQSANNDDQREDDNSRISNSGEHVVDEEVYKWDNGWNDRKVK
jgi:hypothetical protein